MKDVLEKEQEGTPPLLAHVRVSSSPSTSQMMTFNAVTKDFAKTLILLNTNTLKDVNFGSRRDLVSSLLRSIS